MIVNVLEPMIARPVHRTYNNLTEEQRLSVIGYALTRTAGKEAIVNVLRKVLFDGQNTPDIRAEHFLSLMEWVEQFDLDVSWLREIIHGVPIRQSEIEFWYHVHASFKQYMDKEYLTEDYTISDFLDFVYGQETYGIKGRTYD